MSSQATKAQGGALTQSLWEGLVVCVSVPACARTEGKRRRLPEETSPPLDVSFHVESCLRAPFLASCHAFIHLPRG